MCGRYTLTSTDRPALSDRFRAPIGHDAESLLGRFNVAPGQEVLTISDPGQGDREASPARWGLVPAWADDLKVGYRMINARSERVLSSRAYAPLARRAGSRCLIPADGFFEWLPPGPGERRKRPVRFTIDGGVPFSMAGLVTERDWNDGTLRSCTILTTDANELVSEVHDRMPVLFSDRSSEEAWIAADLEGADLLTLCKPFDSARMIAHPANPILNRVGEAPEGPELLDPDGPEMEADPDQAG